MAQLFLAGITFCIYYLNAVSYTQNIVSQFANRLVPAQTLSLITPWLFLVYVSAVSFKLVKAFYSWYSFKQHHFAALIKPSIDLKLFTATKAFHFGIKRKVQLWFSNTVNVPVTFGFLKPVIILPVALVNHISLQQAQTLILHELSHIKANDYLLNWFLIVAENIFFFNPFIIILSKKIRLEREKNCDSNVIAFQYAPLLYAETLLQVQCVQQQTPQYQLAAVTGKKQLLQRIHFFTTAKNFKQQKTSGVPLAAFTLLTGLVFAVAIIFQFKISGSKKQLAPVATLPPATSYSEVAFPVFVNNIIENLTDEKLKEIQAAVEKQQPLIEQKIKELEPLIKSIEEKAINFAEVAEEILATPVALKETITTKQIIVQEEESGSKNATLKVYTISFIDGEWVLMPEWMLTAKEINSDSLQNKIDTSLIKQ